MSAEGPSDPNRPAQEGAEASNANTADAHRPAPAPIRVLIVDDDREIRETLGELLTEEGFQIEAAWNGETALNRLEAGFRPDVIVLDVMMPGMDGLTFRALQRSHPALADIPVIGLTAMSLRNADFEWMRKPLQFDALVQKLRRVAADRPPGPIKDG
jgi:CheY-like chemotaxis protein